MAPSDLKETIYKVAMSIPTEGHTLPEAYDNHLIHAQRLGAWEQKLAYENSLVKVRELVKAASTQEEYKAFLKKCPPIITGEGKELKIQDIKFHPVRFEIYWYTTGRLLTQMAREKLMQEALKANCDFVMMYDDDMILPPEFASKMLDDMINHPEVDVLGALAFMRNPPHYPVMYSVVEGFDNARHLPYYLNTCVKKYPRERLVECDAVGFGGVCIRLNFVKNKLEEPYFMSTTQTGEDIWFCVKVKRAHGRVFMDTRIKMGHLKNPEIVDEAYFDKWIKDHKHNLGNDIKKYDPVESGEIPHKSLAINK